MDQKKMVYPGDIKKKGKIWQEIGREILWKDRRDWRPHP
jgi:hypothetical protein